MKINQIKDALAVAQKHSFRSAARHLHTTQSAISRSISELERELGVVLFDRHARGAVLTPIGERFILRASSAMNELQRARDEVKQLQGELVGQIVACLSSGAQARLLPRGLPAFRQRHPEVHIEMIEAQYFAVETEIKKGTIDFYIGPEPSQGVDSDLVAEFFYENPLLLIGRRNHPLKNAKSLQDLQDAKWLGTTTGLPDDVQVVFQNSNLSPPQVVMHCKTIHSIILGVMYSDVLAIIPAQLIGIVKKLELEVFDIQEKMFGPKTILIRKFGMPLTPVAEYFCDMLRREI